MKKIKVIFEKVFSRDQKDEIDKLTIEMLSKGFDCKFQSNTNVCNRCGQLKTPVIVNYRCDNCDVKLTPPIDSN